MALSRDRTGLTPDKTPDWVPDSVRLPPGGQVVTAFPSSGGIEFDQPTKDAIVAIAGDAGSGGSVVAVPTGYTVDVSGTSEVLLCAGPCDVAQLLHSKTAGATITLKDAGTTGTAAAVLKVIDMATTSQLQMAAASGIYGMTATLSGGSATFLIRPKA